MPTYKEIKPIATLISFILIAIYVGFKYLPLTKGIGPVQGQTVYVSRAVDGDTLKLSDGQRVRLIGVDTPELHYSNKLVRDSRRSHKDVLTIQAMGRRAADFTKNLVQGKPVRLELDAEKYDKYGRMLAYVYLEDGTFVNAKIIEEGYGQVMTIPPNVKYLDHFLKLQREARENGRGLWKSEAGEKLF